LRDEVKSLLAQGGHGASFIESPAPGSSGQSRRPAPLRRVCCR
jgi:hypothetical protein